MWLHKHYACMPHLTPYSPANLLSSLAHSLDPISILSSVLLIINTHKTWINTIPSSQTPKLKTLLSSFVRYLCPLLLLSSSLRHSYYNHGIPLCKLSSCQATHSEAFFKQAQKIFLKDVWQFMLVVRAEWRDLWSQWHTWTSLHSKTF